MTYYIKYTNIMLAFLLLCLGSEAIAQPNWSVNPPEYQYTMTMTGVGLFSCEETIDENDLVAAFVNGECRGVQSFGTDINGRKFAYLIVYDNLASGNEVTFKLYDASEDMVEETVFSAVFEENSSFGNSETPYEFNTAYNLVDLFITNDTIYENAQQGDLVTEVFAINEIGDTLSLGIGFENDMLGLDNDYFTASNNTLILDVDVDYPEKDSYQIHLNIASLATNCNVTGDFTITVFNTNVPPIGLAEPVVSIPENEPVGTLISTLIALDDSPNDNHTFELTGSLENWPDQEAFDIVGAELQSLMSFDYETKDEYTIQVKITDNIGNSYVETMSINILDVIEFDDLKASNLITPNEDGFNDYFELPNVSLFENYRLMIYNDNGNEVFSVEQSYDNSWNGLNNNGKELPSGTYYFLLRDRDDTRNSFVGDLHLYRENKF